MTAEKVEISRAQIVYGEIVYWICIAAALICTIGPVISIWNIDHNVMNPHFVYAALWAGKDAGAIWQEAGGGFPGGHFFLQHLTKGDGLTQFGVALGSISALPALLAAAGYYLKEKPKKYLYAGLAIWVAGLIIVASLGLISIK